MSREAFGDPPESQEPPDLCPVCGNDWHAEDCEFGKEVARRLKAERDAHRLAVEERTLRLRYGVVSDWIVRALKVLDTLDPEDSTEADELGKLIAAGEMLALTTLANSKTPNKPLRRGVNGVCTRSTCECERQGLGHQCVWLKPAEVEFECLGEPSLCDNPRGCACLPDSKTPNSRCRGQKKPSCRHTERRRPTFERASTPWRKRLRTDMQSQKRTATARQKQGLAGNPGRQGRLTWAARAIILCAALLSPAAHAQYKCADGGRITYSEKPCGHNAQELHLNVAPVSPGERAAVIERAEREKVLAGQLETRRAIGDQMHAQRATQFQQAAQQQKARCAELLAIAKDAKNEGSKYRYHEGLIDDARRRQKEAEDEHFSKCFGR